MSDIETTINSYDPTQPDTYTERLGNVNASNEVSVSEDIRNSQGVVLLAKGKAINPSIVQKLMSHRLSKPLESSIQLAGSLTGAQVYEKCQELYFSQKDTDAIYARSNIDAPLKGLCKLLDKNPLLSQKLTVFSLELENKYRNAVFSAVLTTILAQQKKADKKTMACAFFAGLFHDIGILHLEHQLVDPAHSFTPQQWRSYQGHTAISRCILQDMAGLPKLAGQAAFEHHERCDGTGYPFGKSSELGSLGQVVALSDSLTSVYYRTLQPQGRSLNAVLPFLQLNTKTYHYDNFQAAFGLLKSAGLPDKISVNTDNAAEFTANMLKEMYRLLHWSKLTSDLLPILKSLPDDAEAQKLLSQIGLIWEQLKQSGLLSDGLNAWIEHVGKSGVEDAFEEMDEIHLMQTELLWQYRNVHRRLATYVNAPEVAEDDFVFGLMKKIHLLISNLDVEDPKFDIDSTLDIRTIIG